MGTPNQDVRELALRHGAYVCRSPIAIDRQKARRIAKAFDEMPHAPNDPDTLRAYQSLVSETWEQYQWVKELGLKIEAIPTGFPNPYLNSGALHSDVKDGHLWYLPTSSGFGSGLYRAHALLAPTGERIDGKLVLANDLFRIVHDIFGHCKEGFPFGSEGEENAWLQHGMMYSAEAMKAMTTETRGQNSWVNFGPYAMWNREHPEQTRYAEQKMGLLPEWCSEV